MLCFKNVNIHFNVIDLNYRQTINIYDCGRLVVNDIVKIARIAANANFNYYHFLNHLIRMLCVVG